MKSNLNSKTRNLDQNGRNRLPRARGRRRHTKMWLPRQLSFLAVIAQACWLLDWSSELELFCVATASLIGCALLGIVPGTGGQMKVHEIGKYRAWNSFVGLANGLVAIVFITVLLASVRHSPVYVKFLDRQRERVEREVGELVANEEFMPAENLLRRALRGEVSDVWQQELQQMLVQTLCRAAKRAGQPEAARLWKKAKRCGDEFGIPVAVPKMAQSPPAAVVQPRMEVKKVVEPVASTPSRQIRAVEPSRSLPHGVTARILEPTQAISAKSTFEIYAENNGKFLPGLTKHDMALYLNGQAVVDFDLKAVSTQRRTSASILLMVDHRGRELAGTGLDATLARTPDSVLFRVMPLTNGVRFATAWSRKASGIRNALQSTHFGSKISWSGPIDAAIAVLRQRSGTKLLVIHRSDSSVITNTHIQACQAAGIRVVAMGTGSSPDESLQRLANLTNGRYLPSPDAARLWDLLASVRTTRTLRSYSIVLHRPLTGSATLQIGRSPNAVNLATNIPST